MDQSCTSRIRRAATIGTAIALVATSSAFGIGATVAVADESPTTAGTTAGGVAADTTAAPPTTRDAVAGGTGTTADTSTPERPGTDTADTPANDAPAQPSDPAGAPPATPDPAPAPAAPSAPAADGHGGTPQASPTTASPAAADPTDGGPAAADPAAAVPTGTVSIAGDRTTWHTLTATTDGWPADTTFTYAWTIDGAGRNQVVDGATTSHFVTDYGVDRVRVAVTGTTPDAGSATVTSDWATITADAASPFNGGARTVDVTAGERVSIPLQAFLGDQGELRYEPAATFDGTADPSVLPAGFSLSADGVLTGSSTSVEYADFWVLGVTSASPEGSPGLHVTFRMHQAAPVSLRASVWSTSATTYDVWNVAPDGSTVHSTSPEVQAGDPAAPLRLPQTAEPYVDVVQFDRYGNGEPAAVQVSSSVESDTVTSEALSHRLRFAHASTHVITATTGALSISIPIEVDPVAGASTATHGTGSGGGRLAFTGADTSGPLAWALGLVASGAGLLLLRLRRRRA
ncbi:hypothetical protein ACTJKO_12780 [Curtobacterium sp. 22159]|uniref:hypothetical protein n=1 Tax=Curtobacterium sp. 22159 TaxID=3453882 RepID=UPI003F876280